MCYKAIRDRIAIFAPDHPILKKEFNDQQEELRELIRVQLEVMSLEGELWAPE